MAPELKVPLFQLTYSEADRRAADRVLAEGWMTSGSRVRHFEQQFAAMLGAQNVVAVSSCTAAMHLALSAFGIGPGDEVIVPALTFVATANVVLARNATPVFADITSLHEPVLDPASVARLIGPRTKAVMPVHYAGHACDIATLRSVVGPDIRIIEDAAHACVTYTSDGACGTLGDAGAFSFFSNKNLSVGEGGALVVGDDAVCQRVRRLASHGMSTGTMERHRGHAHSYDVDLAGHNYRWDELRAAIATTKLERLPAELEARQRIGASYRAKLYQRLPAVLVPFSERPGTGVALHIFPVLLPRDADRSKVMDAMRVRGVQTSVHYPLIPGFHLYEGRFQGEWANARDYCLRVLTLPLFPSMTDGQIDLVVEALESALWESERS